MAGIQIHEGSIVSKEADYLSDLVRDKGPIRVAQVGLGIGWSAWAFLSANPDLHLITFDNRGHGDSSDQVGMVLAKHFPGRHIVVWGDSTVMVPKWDALPNEAIDLVFIDGGHHYETALADLKNFAAPGRIVVMDDMQDDNVKDAWADVVTDGIVRHEELLQDGHHKWARGVYA